MLKVKRTELSLELQVILAEKHAAIENGTAPTKPWEGFKALETRRKKAHHPTVLNTLEVMFNNKCAYCESEVGNAGEIEHHWPKVSHPHNANRGTSQKMFQWDNLLLACNTCNVKYKKSHMEWDGDNPRLLNPCIDDPLCFLEVVIDFTSEELINIGRIQPIPDLLPQLNQRAEYTIDLLKLNKREGLRTERSRVICDFLILLEALRNFGPNHQTPPGRTVKQGFLETLKASKSYLASIRQYLHYNQDEKNFLLTQIPEVTEIIELWDLPVEGCE